jgi:hypothetical protein
MQHAAFATDPACVKDQLASASSAPLCLQPHGNMPCGISISALCLTLGQPCVTAVHEDAAMQHATHALCTNAKGVTSAAVPERALWLG